VLGTSGTDFGGAQSFSPGFLDVRKEAEVAYEMIGRLKAGDFADFSNEDSGCFGSDSWDRGDEIDFGWALGRCVQVLCDHFIQVGNGCFQIGDLLQERGEDLSPSLLSLSGVDGFFGKTDDFFSFLPVEVIALKGASYFFQSSGMNKRNVLGCGVTQQDVGHDLSERIFHNRCDLWEDDLQERVSLSLVVLEVGDKAVASSDQVSQALDHVIGDVAGPSFTGAKKAGDAEGVDVIGFCLFGQEFPIAVGLEGIEQKSFDFLSLQERKEIFPEMACGFHACDHLGRVDVPVTQKGDEFFKSFGRRIDRETCSDLFPLRVQKSTAMGFETEVDAEIKHKAPFFSPERDCFAESSRHGNSSIPEIRIAWSILSGDEDESPHSILNKCLRPQRRKATVFLKRSKRPQGDKQVVFPPEEDRSLKELIVDYSIYKQKLPTLSYLKNISDLKM